MIRVTAAILRRDDKILICRRGEGGSCSGLWEFPGGKLEPGETPEDCLMRECREELGVDVRLHAVFAETSWRYPDKEVAITFYLADIVSGSLMPAVHRDVRWVLPAELAGYEFCPADVEVATALAHGKHPAGV